MSGLPIALGVTALLMLGGCGESADDDGAADQGALNDPIGNATGNETDDPADGDGENGDGDGLNGDDGATDVGSPGDSDGADGADGADTVGEPDDTGNTGAADGQDDSADGSGDGDTANPGDGSADGSDDGVDGDTADPGDSSADGSDDSVDGDTADPGDDTDNPDGTTDSGAFDDGIDGSDGAESDSADEGADDGSNDSDADDSSDTGTDSVPEGDDDADNSSPVGDAARPGFAAGSSSARVYSSLTTVVGNTLLDLNRLLAGGMDLTPQQNDCLGSFDPAFGEFLLDVDCVRALATDGVAIYVKRGAFFPTDACKASIMDARIDNCIVQIAEVSIRDDFSEPTPPARPQPLPGTGVEIEYRIDDADVMLIKSNDDALTGAYSCVIDTGTTGVLDADCESRVRAVADRMDLLQSRF